MDLITDYKYIRGWHGDDFVNEIQYAMLDGYQPLGTPSIFSYDSLTYDDKPTFRTYYQQVMVKPYPPIALELEWEQQYGNHPKLRIKPKTEEVNPTFSPSDLGTLEDNEFTPRYSSPEETGE